MNVLSRLPALNSTHFFKAALKKNLSPGYVKEDLVQLGLSEEKATNISSKVDTVWDVVHLTLCIDTLHTHTHTVEGQPTFHVKSGSWPISDSQPVS